MRNGRLQRVESVVEGQQRITPEATITASSSIDRTVDLGSFGPVTKSVVDVRFLHLATVF